MATNPITPEQRKIVSVEILHLDEKGYGPQGKHTRREWRDECLKNLLAGSKVFNDWQDSWLNIEKEFYDVSHEAKVTYDDGSQELILSFDNRSRRNNHSNFAFDFVGRKFETELVAILSQFRAETLFNAASFIDHAHFGFAQFHNRTNFAKSTFNRNAYFGFAQFNNITVFKDSVFKGEANFICSNFTRYANFKNATFLEIGNFLNFDFKKEVSFQGSIFQDSAYFCKINFCGGADFSRTNFKQSCNFNDVRGDSTVETQFLEVANFENATFDNLGHFERVRFLKETPKFRGCKIGDTRLEFSDDSYFPQDEKGEDAVKNISFLKRLAEEHGQTDQALNFNAMELRAKRKQVKPKPASWSFKAMTWLYELLSNYGRSFTRPLWWYLGLIVLSYIFAFLSAFHPNGDLDAKHPLCKSDQSIALSEYRAASEYALFRAGGLMDFTDTGKQNNSVNCRLFGEPIEPPLMRAWGIFKGIASLALLFLAALGLRNKYRIK